MPDYAGPLQRVVLSRTLWVIVALPLLGLAWHLVLWRRRRSTTGRGEPTEAQLSGARNVGVGTALVTAAALVHRLRHGMLAPAADGRLSPFL